MKIIGLTGYKGRVGSYLLSHYSNYVPLECDVTQSDQVENCIRTTHPDLVLHLAAKSDIDFCEKPENEKVVSDVNLRGTFSVCHAAELQNIQVILLSSDHVFGGWRGRYKEKHKPDPVNQYGMSKFAAESLQKVFDNLKIVRTSYLFDYTRLESKIQSLRDGTPELYPTFIGRTFLHLDHFCQQIDYYLTHFENMPPILHLGGNKLVSWYDFMIEVAKHYDIQNYKKLVVPRREASMNLAPRPRWAGLDVRWSRKLGIPQFSYQDGIKIL